MIPVPCRISLRKRSVVIAGYRTSVSLEGVFWDTLAEIAATRGVSINRLITEIDRDRSGNLSSANGVYVVERLHERSRWSLLPCGIRC